MQTKNQNCENKINQVGKGRLLSWILWKIIEVVLIILSFTSFLISYYSYYKNKQKKNKKPLKSLQSDSTNSPTSTSSPSKVSIVIAIKNEAKYIGKTIRNFESTTIDKTGVEIILVDSGSRDNSIEVARSSAGVIPIRFLKGNPKGGRGSSLNQGASNATGDYLLFLRADSLVPPGYDETIRRELSNPETLLTAFRFSYDISSSRVGYLLNSLNILSLYYNLLSIFCYLPNGSQGYAITRSTYHHIIHYSPDILLMEDIHFILSLRHISLNGGGNIKILEQSIQNSINEVITMGILKYTLCNHLAYLLLFYLNMKEETVYRWCYIRIPKSLYFITI